MRHRPLLLLTTTVLAVHVALLAWSGLPETAPTARITGSTPQELRFETRQITPEPPAPPAPEPPRVATPAPARTPAPPRPPAPRVQPQKAPPQQAPESLAVVGPTLTPSAKPDAAAESAASPAAPPATSPAAAPPSALDGLLSSEAPSEGTGAADAAAAPSPSPAASPAVTSTSPPASATTAPGDSDDGDAPTSTAKDGAPADPPAPVGIGSAGYGSPLPPVRVPPSASLQFEAKGSAKGFQYSAKAQLSFKTDGLTYQARQEVSAFLVGNRAQTSTGRITPHGLAPQRFGDKARSERAAHIDADRGRITYSGNDEAQSASAGVQDRLSIFMQLASMVAAGPERYPPGTLIHINVTSARAADVWTFVVDGPETLDLPAGQKATIRLSRQPRKRYDQSAHLWLAPDMQYLPVRIRINQANGDFADLQLQSAQVERAATP